MITVIVWDMCGVEPLRFIAVNADVTHLDGIYINHCDQPQDKQEELLKLIYKEDGRYRENIKMFDKFPTRQVLNQGKGNVSVITAGFLP